ncbi:LysR family transcriptional regulator [Pollutimonas thiosulfatoxidans]|uniref:LysR family transcriptional regulator n=1 Tax=Pollutimonas thiosulfatoxidans TaxID=2028345 RepID=A0A410GFP0_9BURK|nr:LysR family transcriptional regulator [Pollutimonas thiosulfatoxidans]QAA95065.1 LysR family transcriptional regulator [Pollutimonas thiosulfatoxidans]
MSNYDLTDLKIFLAVAQEGNIKRGAERSYLAPSSVSLRIKNLEEAIGASLLTRGARGVTLTPAGQVFVEHASRCVAQLNQMHADLSPYAQGVTGHLTLFANNNALSSFLPDDLATFFKLYPTVRVTLEERMSHDIVAAVASGRADVGIVALDTTHPGLELLPYRVDRLVLLAPLKSRIAREKSVSFSRCIAEPFISLQSGAALHTYLVNQAMALGKRLDIRVQVSGFRAISRLVASGAGVGVVPRTALERTDTERLAVIELTDDWSYRNLQICCQPHTPQQNVFARSLIEILRKPS